MRYFEEGTRTVYDDTTVQVDGAWYAARPAPIGSEVLVRVFEHEVEIRDAATLALIRRHTRLPKGKVHLPEAERVFNPSRQTQHLLARAETIGPHTHTLCQALFERRGREAHKSLWGIVGLGGRYPTYILEHAAAAALAQGVRSYKAVRALADQALAQALGCLESAQGELPLTPRAAPALTQSHELIRQSAEYAEFFARSVCATQGEEQPVEDAAEDAA